MIVKIRALSVKQPWAEAIACGLKTIETRTWRTHYRGPLLIVASKSYDFKALRTTGLLFSPEAREYFVDKGPGWLRPDRGRGVAVCMADLYDCRLLTGTQEEREASQVWNCAGLYGWCLRDVRRVHSVPIRGRLGLYEVDIPDEYLETRSGR